MLDARHHRLRPSLAFGPRLGVGWGFAQVLSPLLGDTLIFAVYLVDWPWTAAISLCKWHK